MITCSVLDERAGLKHEIQAGQLTSGFVEATSYLLEARGATDVYVDDIPLARRAPGVFEWCPGFFAGRVTAHAYADAALILSFELGVGPSDQKLGEVEFDGMVDALASKWPSLLLGTQGEAGSFGALGQDGSPEVMYLRLRNALPDFFSAMRKVCRNPIVRLKQERHSVLPHRARRMDLATARELTKTRYGAQLLAVGSDITAAPSLVSVPFTGLTTDNPPNRHIASRIDALQAAADRLIRKWSIHNAGGHDPDLQRKLPRRLQVLRAASAELSRIRRAEPFCSVRAAEVSAAGLNAIAAHPDYARASLASWKALRRGTAGTESEALPFSPTWQVYERWCFMRISEELMKQFPAAGWTIRSPLKCVGSIHNATVTLHLQPTFHAWGNRGGHEFRSLSRQREPDIVLTVESGSAAQFLVLDAKYRVSRDNVLDAMSSAHIYNDSLRWRGHTPSGSYLLLPRAGQVDWLREPSFRDEHQVGVFALSPTCTDIDLWNTISSFITTSASG